MAQVAVAVSYRDTTAVVTGRCIHLESSKLIFSAGFLGRCCSVARSILGRTVGRFAQTGQQRCTFCQSHGGSCIGFQTIHHRTGHGNIRAVPRIGFIRCRCRTMVVTAHECQSQPTCDVIDNALGDTDILVGRVTHWLETCVAELVHENFQRNAVLQRNRQGSPKAIHDATDR